MWTSSGPPARVTPIPCEADTQALYWVYKKNKTWLLQLVGSSGHTGDTDPHTPLCLSHPGSACGLVCPAAFSFDYDCVFSLAFTVGTV